MANWDSESYNTLGKFNWKSNFNLFSKVCIFLEAKKRTLLLLLLTAIELSFGGSTDKTRKKTYINETIQEMNTKHSNYKYTYYYIRQGFVSKA
jgi:hypothetical protein